MEEYTNKFKLGVLTLLVKMFSQDLKPSEFAEELLKLADKLEMDLSRFNV